MQLEKRHWDALCLQIDATGNTSAAPSASVPAQMVSELFSARLWENSLQLTQVADRRKLFGFAAMWGLTLQVFSAAGATIAACNICLSEPASFKQVTVSGKGFTVVQAVLSCLGEAVEVVSWVLRSSDTGQSIPRARRGALPTLSAQKVLGFSRAQIRDRSILNRRWMGWDAVPPARALLDPELGIEVSSRSGPKKAWCPAFLCSGGFGEIHHFDETLNTDSNGCAAGITLDAAYESAILELAERDATGIWWWRGCRRVRISPERIEDTELRSALVEHSEETGRSAWFLDISTFENARVVAALSCEADGGKVAVGFAAAFSTDDAMRSAFLELVQTEMAIEAHEFRLESGGGWSPAADSRLARWLTEVNLAELEFLRGEGYACAAVPLQRRSTLAVLSDEMSSLGHDVWFANLERSDIGVPVVKAICEGLAHFKPRFGCQRLWTLPEDRGWQTTFGGIRSRRPPPLLV